MKKFISLFLLLTPLLAHALQNYQTEPKEIVIHNRILAKVNDKTFSVFDVMKQMDMFLSRFYPHVLDSKEERYQFYANNWTQVLKQMIDSVLILADSEGKELKIKDSEIRENLLERFGPNVLANLEKVGLSLDEAKQMIKDELAVQQMTWFRVNGKAVLSVNPQDVKAAYKKYLAENPPEKQWKYQILSIKANQSNVDSKLAEKAFGLLTTAKLGLAGVADQLKREDNLSASIVTVSQEFEGSEKTISQSHKEGLCNLKPGQFSNPISQVNRIDQSVVYRIYHLIDQMEKAPTPFEEMAVELENELIQKAVAQENKNYLPKLREKYGITEKLLQEMIPSNFEPFSLAY